jgi:hypothetical protein
MNNQLPINYTNLDVRKFFSEIGAEKEWTEKATPRQLSRLLGIIWNQRYSIKWENIPAELKNLSI